MLKLYEIKQLKRLDRILFNLFLSHLFFNAMIMSAVLFSLKASNFRENIYMLHI